MVVACCLEAASAKHAAKAPSRRGGAAAAATAAIGTHCTRAVATEACAPVRVCLAVVAAVCLAGCFTSCGVHAAGSGEPNSGAASIAVGLSGDNDSGSDAAAGVDNASAAADLSALMAQMMVQGAVRAVQERAKTVLGPLLLRPALLGRGKSRRPLDNMPRTQHRAVPYA
eukprot:366328-Chlamydomonas_euryale.AAC.6